MWPWDHVALAYLSYALYARATGRRPSDATALAVVIAAVAPDMIDKPLSWWVGVLPSGRSLGHSAFTAVVVVAAAGVVQRRVGPAGLTPAVAFGYVSHLLGDVAYPLIVKRELRTGFLSWPLVASDSEAVESAFGHLGDLAAAFAAYLSTPAGIAYLLADLTLLSAALAVWLADGAPGVHMLRRAVAHRRSNRDGDR